MKLSIGSDHGGFELKEELKRRLLSEGLEVLDRGCHSSDPVDYPDIALIVSNDVASGATHLGILVCGTGIGMSNAASRIEGIVAALCSDCYSARMAREHNAANVLCLGGRVIGPELAWSIARTFISTAPLTDAKYVRRRAKVASIGGGQKEKGGR